MRNLSFSFVPFFISLLRVISVVMLPGFEVSWAEEKSALASKDEQLISSEQSQSLSRDMDTLDLLLNEIDMKSAKVDELIEIQKNLSAEDRSSLEIRVVQYQIEIMGLYDRVTELVLSLRANGEPTDTYDARLKQEMLPIGPYIRNAILDKSSQNLSERVDPMSNEGIHFFENKEQFLNKALTALSNHVRNLNLLGFDSRHSTTYLREELQRRAENLTGKIYILKDRSQDNEKALATDSTNQSLINFKRGAEVQLQQMLASLRLTIGLMESNQISANEFKTALIQTSGKVTREILDPEVFSGVVRSWWKNTKSKLYENGVDVLINIFYFIFIMAVFYVIAKVTSVLVKAGLQSSRWNISSLMRDMINHTVFRLVILIGILFALAQLGVSWGPILAGLGLAGFAVAFAMQDVISNFASGVMILLYRPYDVGDYVEISGEFGKVKSMSLVSTSLVTIDNQSLIIPNSKIWGNIIKNVTAQSVRRVDMVFGVSYSDDLEKVETVLTSIIEDCERVLKRPEPVIKLHQLNSSSVDFIVRPWVKTDDYWDVYWDVTRQVKQRFDKEGISIPFPQQDVHLYSQIISNTSGDASATNTKR